MHSKIDNIEIMINCKADKVIEELFDSLIKEFENGLEKLMKRSDFIFHCVRLLYCKYHNMIKCDRMSINFKRGRLYIDSLDWIKNRKAAKNSIYKIDKYI